MNKINIIIPKLSREDSIVIPDYINNKQRLINFKIKNKNLYQRLFTRTKRNTKNSIKKVNK